MKVFLVTILLIIFSNFAYCQNDESSIEKFISINLGVGISGQFFLISGDNPNINGYLVSQPYPHRSASGFGIPLFIEAYIKTGFGIEYSPVFRYDYIRHTDKNFASNESAIYEVIFDHHLTLIYKFKGNLDKCMGFGASVITTNKGYDALIITSNSNGIYQQEYIDLHFEGIHILGRMEILKKLMFELKLTYIPPGNISYKPYNTYSIFPILAVKYRLIGTSK